jgi:D-sedoheptulose 7-phosphate isomerase
VTATAELDATVAARIEQSVQLQRRLLQAEYLDAIARAAATIVDCFRTGGKLLLFGNGGSAADAQHIAAEFLGRYLRERQSLPAIALADNNASLTAIANDYSFDQVFARQLEGLCRSGDVALGISTSGNSANVIAGLAAAERHGARTIGLTGHSGGRLASLCEICIHFPSDDTPRIQEGHILIAHILCEVVEDEIADACRSPRR